MNDTWVILLRSLHTTQQYMLQKACYQKAYEMSPELSDKLVNLNEQLDDTIYQLIDFIIKNQLSLKADSFRDFMLVLSHMLGVSPDIYNSVISDYFHSNVK